VGQGDEMAIRAEWIRFRGADGGVGRGNEQEGEQNARESSGRRRRRESRASEGERKREQTDGWMEHNRIDLIRVLQAIFIQVF
jgi:hypothetical protein